VIIEILVIIKWLILVNQLSFFKLYTLFFLPFQ